MDEFTRALKARVDNALGKKAPWENINPLITIGLTEALLDLHLTEDQMYAAVRSYVRQLAAQVHPDRSPTNVSAERQREFIDAFSVLDNRDLFSRALKEFRELKAEDRRENKLLRESLLLAKAAVNRAQSKELELSSGLSQLRLDRQRLDAEEEERSSIVPKLNNELQRTMQLNQTLHVRNLRASRKNADLDAFISLLCSRKITGQAGIHALDARWVIVASLVPENVEGVEPPLANGKWNTLLLEVLLALSLPDEKIQELQGIWQEAVKTFGTRNGAIARTYRLRLSVFRLLSGKTRLLFGYKKALKGGRVIGCIDAPTAPFERHHLFRTVATYVVFSKITPYLVPGRLLVSRVVMKTPRNPAGMIRPIARMQTKRFILAVG